MVPDPATIVALVGTVQLYIEAPATAGTEYVTLVSGAQIALEPVMAEGAAGAEEQPQPMGCQVVPINDSRQLVVILKTVYP